MGIFSLVLCLENNACTDKWNFIPTILHCFKSITFMLFNKLVHSTLYVNSSANQKRKKYFRYYFEQAYDIRGSLVISEKNIWIVFAKSILFVVDR